MLTKPMETDKKLPQCLIFFSWQADRHDCRNFVYDVMRKLRKETKDIAESMVERDTCDLPGSPEIAETIYDRIEKCDVFIADVTLINDKEPGKDVRRTPNPNVMIELGYAIKALGWDRIIMLQCQDYGDIEELPFDINHNRICNFSLNPIVEDGEEKKNIKSESKKKVMEDISETIRLLKEKNQLFGGHKKVRPKMALETTVHEGLMSSLKLKMRNVSSSIISELESHGIKAVFSDQSWKEVPSHVRFSKSSLMQGEETDIVLGNGILGAGQGYNNAVWENFDLLWQFSCEDEENNIYWYEASIHINDANKINLSPWKIKYIG